MRTPSPYIGHGWTDYVEIWYVVKDQLAKQFTQTKDGVYLHLCMCARADVPTFPYLRNGLMDCAEIRYVVRDPLAILLQKLRLGHSCT